MTSRGGIYRAVGIFSALFCDMAALREAYFKWKSGGHMGPPLHHLRISAFIGG
jgi:hypothetical protein